jgi:hypothetical protein
MNEERGAGGAPKRPARRGSPLPGSEAGAESSSPVASTENEGWPAPSRGERCRYYCHACEHEADATYTDKYHAVLQWLVGCAPVDRCPKGAECLRLTAEWISEHFGRVVTAPELKADPRPFISALFEAPYQPPYSGRNPGLGRRPEVLRSKREWAAALLRLRVGTGPMEEARDYLGRRGIDPRQHDLGFHVRRGYDAIVARGFCGAAAVTEVFRWYGRRPVGRKKDDVLTGRAVGWIAGRVPASRDVLIVAGFFDVLSARQAGIPAVSAVGTAVPAHLLPDLYGKLVAVAFDVGEEAAAGRTVARLRAAGIDAFEVRIAGLGLPRGGDLNDFFCTGGSTCDLRRLIREEWKRSR